MAIHRVGRPQGPHRTTLGGVLVTVDDLHALMALLAHHDTLNGSPADPVKVEFNGGYFTDAEDLNRLTEYELESLRIIAPTTQIVLSRSQAVLIGTREIGEIIKRDWAQTRPIRFPVRYRLRHVKWRMVLWIYFPAAAVCLAGTLLTAAATVGTPGGFTPNPIAITIATLIGLQVALTVSFGVVYAFMVPPPSFAVIYPITLEEYRRQRRGDVMPRWGVFATSAGVVATIAAAALTVLVAK